MAPAGGDEGEGRRPAETVFRDFVRNANAVGHLTRTTRRPYPELDPDTVSAGRPVAGSGRLNAAEACRVTGRVLLLTRRKSSGRRPDDGSSGRIYIGEGDTRRTAPLVESLTRPPAVTEAGTLVPVRSEETLETEALVLVPDVAVVAAPAPPVPELSEDGQIPAGELDRFLADMNVLLRYGHVQDVRHRLEELCRGYPEDLLLQRRIAEFHLETGDRRGAMAALFVLAGRLFERRNVLGMRRALEQVLVLDPDNRRAYKLLGLLSTRPSTGTGG